MILLFDMGPVHSSEVLSGVPEPDRAVMCLREKIHVLDKPCSEDLSCLVLSALSSKLLTQQCILNKVFHEGSPLVL